MEYIIDIVGTCNLRCPSCPVGNFSSTAFAKDKRAKGFMQFPLFEQITEKIEAESMGNERPRVFLYNWGEPLIHPRIVDFVSLLSARKLPFFISSNMNNEAPLKQIVRAGPSTFRISLSGFSQDTYGRGHVGGDRNLVISNMYRLRHAMDHCHSRMPVVVYYHVYKDNAEDDLIQMARLAESLGFHFHPGWAYFMGLEKILDYLQGKESFTTKDHVTLNRTVLSLDEALAISREAKSPTCYLQTGQTVINHDGSVALCCAVYDPVHFVSDDFLSIDAHALKAKREANKLCTACMANGVHDYAMYNPKELWDTMAGRKQVEAGQRWVTTMFSSPHLHIRKDSALHKLQKRISKVISVRLE